MHVNEIHLIQYRNYRGLKVRLNPKLNIFLGKNAQGKTNLLEAIYLGAAAKSFRGNKDQEMIQLGKNAAYVGISYEDDLGEHKLEFKFQKDKTKRFKKNGLELQKTSEIIGHINVVIFSPEDLKIVKEGPIVRRAFLNNELSQIKPRYRYALYKYNKVIRQKNNYLKSIKYGGKDEALLDVYDDQLAEYGSDILKFRIQFIDRLSIFSKKIHEKITHGAEELKLKYETSVSLDGDLRENLKRAFVGARLEDIEKTRTSVGPHRDDFSIWINDLEAKVYASQGQQRTAALSVKLAEVDLMKAESGEYPILLLDDVLSELDLSRRQDLISAFKGIQTIVTTTDDEDLRALTDLDKSFYHISEGDITKVE